MELKVFKKEYKIQPNDQVYFIVYKYKNFPLNLLGWIEFDPYDYEVFFTYEEASLTLQQYINSL